MGLFYTHCKEQGETFTHVPSPLRLSANIVQRKENVFLFSAWWRPLPWSSKTHTLSPPHPPCRPPAETAARCYHVGRETWPGTRKT
jgi:hypothetical protein